MQTASYSWDSQFNGEPVKKTVHFLSQGDFGFSTVSTAEKRLESIALQHVSATPMFYILCAYLDFKGKDVPHLDFGDFDDCSNFDHEKNAKKLLKKHESYLKEGVVLFREDYLNEQPTFIPSGVNYRSSYPTYLTKDKNLGFVQEDRDRNGNKDEPLSLEFSMVFSETDAIKAMQGLKHIYQAEGIRVVLMGFKKIADYFEKK